MILTGIGVTILGIVRINDVAIGMPVLIVIGILLLIVVIVRWKDLEEIWR